MKWLKRHWLDILLIIAIAAVSFYSFRTGGPASADPPEVVILRLDGDVEYALVDFISQGIKDAVQQKARAVVVEIATFGGRVDAMTDIGEIMTTARIPVYTFVRGKALSAGAYIALSGKKLIMTPEAAMGASEPRTLDNKPVYDEKVMATMRGLFRAAAEARQARGAVLDPTIAEGMVDSTVEIKTEGIRRSGELVVLTGSEALRLGYCDGLASTREQALLAFGFDEGVNISVIAPSPAQRLARLLSGPYISMLLIVAGILGILIEVMTPGFGVPGTIGLISFALFFGSRIFANMAGLEVLGLFLLGLLLLVLEAMAPGFGILGISGIISLSSGIVLAYPSRTVGLWSLGLSILWLVFLGRIVFRTLGSFGAWDKLILRDSLVSEAGFVSSAPRQNLLGRNGVALTVLRPAGSVEIDDLRIDAVSEGTYINAGTPVRVVQVEGNRVVVRPIRPISE